MQELTKIGDKTSDSSYQTCFLKKTGVGNEKSTNFSGLMLENNGNPQKMVN